jgi:hypothetical protein
VTNKFVRGALVQYMQTFLLPVPNVIVFQFNPETMSHSWSQAEQSLAAELGSDPLAVKGVPGESFSFTLALNADEMIAEGSPLAEGIARTSGIYSRLAALEMLLYPAQESSNLLGSVSAAVTSGSPLAGGESDTERSVPAMQVPTVLFVWGPGRIVPVRLTSLEITERLYDRLLNPTYVEAGVGLSVLTPEELQANKDKLADVARMAYVYSQGLRQALATANLGEAAESIRGMLPTI